MNKVKLGDVITLHRGYDLPSSQRVEGSVPVIGSSGVSGTHNVAKLNGQNVITGRYGTIGEVYYHDGPCWPLNTTLYVEDFHGNNPRYCSYLLEAVLGSIRIDGSDKSTVPGVDRNVLHALSVPFIDDVGEQISVSRLLSALDDKIDLNRRMMAELEEATRLIYDYWFTQFDFPDENGNPYRSSGGKMVYNEALKREIPEGWEDKTLGDYAIPIRDSVLPSTGVRYEHYSIPAYDAELFPSFVDGSDIASNKYRVSSDCLLYSKLNPKFKRLWQPYCLTNKAICSTEFIVMQPKNADLATFCRSVVDSEKFYAYMVGKAVSSTGSRSRVDSDVAFLFCIATPHEMKILNSYCDYVGPIYGQIQQLQIECHELLVLCDRLLPLLMNGQVTIVK